MSSSGAAEAGAGSQNASKRTANYLDQEEADLPKKKRIRKSRSKGLRTRTGCTACRNRHVKCSEGKPRCQACEKIDRECVYPLDPALESVEDGSIDGEPENVAPPAEQVGDQLAHIGSKLPTNGSVATLPSIHDAVFGPGNSITYSSMGWSPGISQQTTNEADTFGASPDSTWSGSLPYSAETASLRWFGLLATDATQGTDFNFSPTALHSYVHDAVVPLGRNNSVPNTPVPQNTNDPNANGSTPGIYVSQDEVMLREHEIPLFQHFVRYLSSWIDITDPGKSFSVLVPQMALRNLGLMNAILALSSRHLSLGTSSSQLDPYRPSDRTQAVQYYNETLRYLQQAMKIVSYLRSDELLATVLTISTYEMIDGSGRGWERHLKGVFWIQRSQLIHGESGGLKKCIWWAWLRQDIWAAYKERRKILSFYTLTRACRDLDFWELVNRAVFLLGQCVNYASETEAEAGRLNVQMRLQRADSLWASLEEWRGCFAIHDRRLPSPRRPGSIFEPVWVNPPAASLAVQVHHFSKLLLLEHMPAFGGLKELASRQPLVQESVDTICGIASCTTEEAAIIVSTQCLYAAGTHIREPTKQQDVLEMLHAHQSKTGWPHYDIGADLRAHWSAS